MHIAYRIYSFLCSAHFAFCVLVISLGYNAPVILYSVEVQDNIECFMQNASRQHPEAHVSYTESPLSGLYFLACMSASAFSIVYLVLLESKEEDYTQQDLLADLLFWCFTFAQFYVSLATNTLKLVSQEYLFLRLVLFCCTCYWICSPLEEHRGPDICTSASFVVFIALSFQSVTLASCNQSILVLCYLHRFMDFLLLLGHRWDKEPEAEGLLNCRVFYVAFTGVLLHADMILYSIGSKL